MSKIGKKPVIIPEGVEVQKKDDFLLFKGKEGVLELKLLPYVNCQITGKEILFSVDKKYKQSLSNWGTIASLSKGAIQGVKEGFVKKLRIEGVGYRASMEGKNLILSVGFSHPIKFEPPASVKISLEKNIIIISGPDKALVGEAAARIRKIKKPDPYKGKGIRYEGEIIKLKAGKKAIAAATS
ncbi:MAG: 50S ribosomal protein L6 [Patescibacteria group bacterium]